MSRDCKPLKCRGNCETNNIIAVAIIVDAELILAGRLDIYGKRNVNIINYWWRHQHIDMLE